MARSRNIKPSFFENEDLADLDPLARLLFIGMWTIADFKGCFEYRPKRLKVQLLPYDDCDIEKLAINLDKSRFISIYSVQGQKYIKVMNFDKHQNPHKNEKEKGSDIPDISERDDIDEKNSINTNDIEKLAINLDENGTDPDKNGIAPADSLNLIPDSLNLIPDCVNPEKPSKTARFSFKTSLVKNGVDPDAASEFVRVRKLKGCADTERAFKSLVSEVDKSGLSLSAAVDFCLNRQKPWASFNAEWYQNSITVKSKFQTGSQNQNQVGFVDFTKFSNPENLNQGENYEHDYPY